MATRINLNSSYNQRADIIEKAIDTGRDKAVQSLRKQYNKLNIEQHKSLVEIEDMNKALEEQVKLIDAICEARKDQALIELKINEYAKASLGQKREIIKADTEALKVQQANNIQSKISNMGVDSKLDQELRAKIFQVNEQIKANEALYKKLDDEYRKNPAAQKQYNEQRYNTAYNSYMGIMNDPNASQAQKSKAQAMFDSTVDEIKSDMGNDKFADNLVKKFNEKAAWNSILTGINDVVGDIHGALDGVVDNATQFYKNDSMGKWESRLQGLQEGIADFATMTDRVDKRLSASGLVKATDYLQKIETYAAQGIAYNLEQRALVGSLGERLLSTFEVTNKSLLQMIRLQQSDLTYAQLGAEAELTQFLNKYFQDTSYLTDMYDSVTSALVEATATMSKENATAFSYSVQKWLASLYSVGMSSNAVNQLATGINALATGNVDKITGNESLRNIFAMSAQRAGVGFSDMLTQGVNAQNVNDLMKSMVEYLQDIAQNTGDQVTKAKYGQIFGVDLADLRAVTNLSSQDIATTYSSNVSYAQAMNEYENQMSQLTQRTHISDLYDNLISNVMFTFGNNVADNEAQFATWKITGAVNDLVNTLGLETSTTVKTLMAIVGGLNLIAPAIETVVDLVSAMGNGALFDNNFAYLFGIDEYTDRGNAYTGTSGVGSLDEVVTGISYSSKATTQGTSRADRSLLSFEENAQRVTSATAMDITSIENSTVRSADDLYAQLFDYRKAVRVDLAGIEPKVIEDLEALHQEEYAKMQDSLDEISDRVSRGNDETVQLQSILRSVRWTS